MPRVSSTVLLCKNNDLFMCLFSMSIIIEDKQLDSKLFKHKLTKQSYYNNLIEKQIIRYFDFTSILIRDYLNLFIFRVFLQMFYDFYQSLLNRLYILLFQLSNFTFHFE